MNNIALLLLVLPLAAYASTPEMTRKELVLVAQAKTTRASQGVGPSDLNYLPYLNGFTMDDYGVVVGRFDGSLYAEHAQTFPYQYAALMGCEKLHATSAPHERADGSWVTSHTFQSAVFGGSSSATW